MIRTLLAAPESQVALPGARQEVQRVVNSGLDVRLMQGTVTSTDLLDAMLDGNYELLYIAAHGTEEGVLFSDGLLSSSALTGVVRARHVTFVYLNTCSSLAVAKLINEQTGAGVVCTISEIGDASAFRTGALFARVLAETGDFEHAYELSKPGNSTEYHYLPPKENVLMSPPSTTIEIQLRQLLESSRDLDGRLHGVDKRLALVEAGQEETRRELGRLASQLDELKQNGETPARFSQQAGGSVAVSRAFIIGVSIAVVLSLLGTILLVALVVSL